MQHYCYILYSAKMDRYYVGHTENFPERLAMHNAGFSKYTSMANDWTVYILIACSNQSVAMKIERHIKSMKSRKYIENLARYNEMIAALVSRYED